MMQSYRKKLAWLQDVKKCYTTHSMHNKIAKQDLIKLVLHTAVQNQSM